MRDGFSEASKISPEVCNVLRQSESISVKSFWKMFALVMSIFSEKEVLKEGKNRKLWDLIVNQGVESVDKKTEMQRW